MTQLPNPFLNSTVIPEPPAVASTADSACRLQNVARPDATAERDPHSISESALASAMTADAAAGPEFADPPVPAAVVISEPPSNEGRPEETPASAPTKNPDVGVLGTDHIHEIFHYVRKLMTGHPSFVVDETAIWNAMHDSNAPRVRLDIAGDPVWADEIQLFIREDGYLKRQA